MRNGVSISVDSGLPVVTGSRTPASMNVSVERPRSPVCVHAVAVDLAELPALHVHGVQPAWRDHSS